MANLTKIRHPAMDPRVRIFRFGQEVDAYVITTQRYLVVVDTFATPELALELMETVQADLAARQLLVINSHADWDHFWGNSIFTAAGPYPAPIIGQEHMLARIRKEAVALQNQQQSDARFENVQIIPPNVTFSDRLTIHGGDLTLELIHTPGHTADHLCLWIPEIRVLIAADAIEKPIPEVGTNDSLLAMRQSFAQLQQLNAQYILPSHGGTHSPDLLQQNIDYFQILERGVAEAMSQNKLPSDWLTRKDLPEALDLAFETSINPADIPSDDDSPFASDFYRDCHLKAVRATVTTALNS